MSRYVDPTKPLSDEDRAYLLSRGYEEQVANQDRRFADGEDGEIEVPTELEVDDDLPEYNEMSLGDLQDECRKRELPITGNKAQLVKRLEDDDAANEQP